MPAHLKAQTSGRFVEIELRLKMAKNKYPLVSEALMAVMALAGHNLSAPAAAPEKNDQTAEAGAAPRRAGPKKGAQKPGPKAKPKPEGKGRRVAAQNPPDPEIAAQIRECRIQAGLSQKALGDKLGLSQNKVSMLENGRQRVSPDTAKKLGRLFKTAAFKK